MHAALITPTTSTIPISFGTWLLSSSLIAVITFPVRYGNASDPSCDTIARASEMNSVTLYGRRNPSRRKKVVR